MIRDQPETLSLQDGIAEVIPGFPLDFPTFKDESMGPDDLRNPTLRS